jgi:PAS domain S-box-containing protein
VGPLDTLDPTPPSLELLLEAMPDGVVVADRNGCILFANRAVAALSGYSKDELVGKPVEDLVPIALRARHKGHRRDYVGRRPVARPMGTELNIQLLTKDQQSIPVDIALSPVQTTAGTAVVAAIRDDRWRRQTEQALREHGQLLELAHDAVLVRREADDVVTFWNQGATETYGYTVSEALGRTKQELLAPSYAGRSPEVAESELRQSGRWEGEVTHTHKDGRRITVSSRRAIVRDAATGLASIFEINRDITAEKEIHERLAVLLDRERLGRELHDGAIQALFSIGLDLQGAAGITAEPSLNNRLEAAVERLDDVVRDLRNYIFGLRPTLAAGSQLDGSLRGLANEVEEQTGMIVALDLPPSLARRLAAHTSALLMVTREALSNAARHGAARTSRVSLRQEGDSLVLEIEDDGTGFDVETVARGQGLDNMRERIEAIGGRLSIDSDGSQGTCITVTLPG